jgi:histidine triad (HIT) family protein
LVSANKPGAQQSVAHFHIHVLPRKRGDDLKLNWGAKPGDPEMIAALAEKIRAGL